LNNFQELPHTSSAINFCELLLSYHSTKLLNILLRRDIDLRIIVTPWIMTLFAKFFCFFNFFQFFHF